MKKIYSFLLISCVALGFVSCAGEEDDIFSTSAAERLNAASDLYSARLTAQPNGWAMQYYPTYDDAEPNGVGYLLLCRFNKDKTVDVSGYNWPRWYERYDTETKEYVMDYEYVKDYREATSYWEVITDNGPVLSFNSYNTNMHWFSDPDFYSEEAEHGYGFSGDYEFIVVDAPEDASYMMLKGKKRGTYNLLTPIEEGIEYSSYMADVYGFQTKIFSPANPSDCRMIIGDSIYVVEDISTGLPSYYPVGSDKVTYQSFNPFLMTKRGSDYYLRFRDEFERDDMEGKLQELRYVPEEDRFVGTGNVSFRIEPADMSEFFKRVLETGHVFTIDRNAPENEMSDKMRTYMNNCQTGLKSLNKEFVFEQVGMNYDEEIGSVKCWYRYMKKDDSAKMEFEFGHQLDGTSFQLTYQQPSTPYAANQASRVAAINALMTEVFSQQFVMSHVTTRFDLSKIKLTSVADPELWFVINY